MNIPRWVRVLGGVAAVSALGLTGAVAANDIKPGKWEFSVRMQMPNMPELPPGVQLPSGVHMGAGGMTMTRTRCVTDIDPIPPGGNMPKPGDRNGHCRIEKMQRNGGTVTWAVDCVSAQGAMHSEGVAHYNGDTMDATFKLHTSGGGTPPADLLQHITGRYLGACTAK